MKPERVRVSSYALLQDKSRILLCRISSQVPNAAGKWTLPGGGLDFGEAPDRAVVREVMEETGLQIRVTGLATVDSQLFDLPDERVHVIRILYRAKVSGGTLQDETDGSTDVARWHTHQEALRLPLVEAARIGLSIVFGRPGGRSR
jgi:8-oxo-dGTP diphosphatase